MIASLSSEWLVHVAQLLWQAWLCSATVLLLLVAARRASPHWRYAGTSLVLLKYVTPPMLPFPGGIFSLASPVGESLLTFRLSSLLHVPAARLIIAFCLAVHVAGTVVALIRIAVMRRRLTSLAGRASRAVALAPELDVRISGEISVAMTFGVRRPVILVPASNVEAMTPSEIVAVIAHEQRHVARRDARAILIESIIAAVWWFDPLLRAVIRERRRLREECCDDEVIAHATSTPLQYARAIRAAAENLSAEAPRFAAAAASGSDLPRRMARLVSPGYSPQRRMTLAQAGAVILVALLMLPGVRISRHNLIAFDTATLRSLGFNR